MPEAHPVYRLDDLKSWSRPGTHLAVVGFPIHHSVSPDMQNAALAALRPSHPEVADWLYHRFEIHPDDLAVALPLFLKAGFKGLNLTIPHKILAVNLVAAIEPRALPIGALNTLKATPTGWLGTNTDGQGLADGILSDLKITISGSHILLLGAGGAARGAAVQCLTDRCASLSILNRSSSTLNSLLEVLAPLKGAIPVAGFAEGTFPPALPLDMLVINATSAGLKPSDPLPVDLPRLPRPAALYDMIYNPRTTALMSVAGTLGIPTANGLSMLVNQGARALAFWSDLTPSASIMFDAAARALSRR